MLHRYGISLHNQEHDRIGYGSDGSSRTNGLDCVESLVWSRKVNMDMMLAYMAWQAEQELRDKRNGYQRHRNRNGYRIGSGSAMRRGWRVLLGMAGGVAVFVSLLSM